jgi:hypothetical protein
VHIVRERTIAYWTESQRKSLEEDRNRKIIEMYLRAWAVLQRVAKASSIEHYKKRPNGRNL